MKKEVRLLSDCIISPLGVDTAETMDSILRGKSGVSAVPFRDQYVHAAKLQHYSTDVQHTRFEKLCIDAVRQALAKTTINKSKTLFILSTTKGNIDQLHGGSRATLSATAAYLNQILGFEKVLTVSNACISGVLAIQVARQYLEEGIYDYAVVLGADILSDFVISGFLSLNAMADGVCKPFDEQRTGINLGEAAAVMILSNQKNDINATGICIKGSAVSNDANHISGPSRTGEELSWTITKALNASGKAANEVDFVSCHGTATRYNDEMEAKALHHAGLVRTPINSLKSYTGHTLGAAGVVETVLSAHSMMRGMTIPMLNFEKPGVPVPITVCKESTRRDINVLLKTASGFGGCNAALVLEKVN